MTDRELMQMVLRALKNAYSFIPIKMMEKHLQAETALRDRLAQLEPEPIAWMVYTEDGQDAYITSNPHDIKNTEKAFPLWAYPKEWVGVTDEEVKEIWQNIMIDCNYIRPTPNLTYDLVREVQNLLKERNT
jgi:uncharacterized UPF0160 family protein